MDTRSDLILKHALSEDRADRDITSRTLIQRNRTAYAVILAKENLVVAGLSYARRAFQLVHPRIRFHTKMKDGARVRTGSVVAELSGSAWGILAGERTALNILQHLSGIATSTRHVSERVRRLGVEVWDTRKTHAGLREWEKYAVRVGGGNNHRRSLAQQFFIKNNHIALCGGVKNALFALSPKNRQNAIVEVRSPREATEAVSAGARRILLDNLSPPSLKKIVRSLRKKRRGLRLEASGGITPENALDYARTGVDAISLGALTHSPRAANLSLKILDRQSPPRPSGRV